MKAGIALACALVVATVVAALAVPGGRAAPQSGSTAARQAAGYTCNTVVRNQTASYILAWSSGDGETDLESGSAPDTIYPFATGQQWSYHSSLWYSCWSDLHWVSQDLSQNTVEVNTSKHPLGDTSYAFSCVGSFACVLTHDTSVSTASAIVDVSATVDPLYECRLRVLNETGVPVTATAFESGRAVPAMTIADNTYGSGWDDEGLGACSIDATAVMQPEICPVGPGGEPCSAPTVTVQIKAALIPQGPSIGCISSDPDIICTTTVTTPEPGAMWLDVVLDTTVDVQRPNIPRIVSVHRAAPRSSLLPASRRGSGGDDRLEGTGGDDRIDPAGGRDAVFSGGGRDTVTSSDGDDMVVAGAGGDRVYGGRGDDWLAGGSGSDLVIGGAGNDLIVSGAGDDVIVARDGDRDIVRCGAGFDIVYADRSDTLRGCEVAHYRAPAERVAAPDGRVRIAADQLPGRGWHTVLGTTGSVSAVRFGVRGSRCETPLHRSVLGTRGITFTRGGAGLSHVQLTYARFRDAESAGGVLDDSTLACLARAVGGRVAPVELAPGLSGYRLQLGSGVAGAAIDIVGVRKGRTSLVAIMTTTKARPAVADEVAVLRQAVAQLG